MDRGATVPCITIKISFTIYKVLLGVILVLGGFKSEAPQLHNPFHAFILPYFALSGYSF
jgi:hypothetical protein